MPEQERKFKNHVKRVALSYITHESPTGQLYGAAETFVQYASKHRHDSESALDYLCRTGDMEKLNTIILADHPVANIHSNQELRLVMFEAAEIKRSRCKITLAAAHIGLIGTADADSLISTIRRCGRYQNEVLLYTCPNTPSEKK